MAVKLTEASLKMHGQELLPLIDHTTDRPGLFLNVDVLVNDNWEDGCILTLQDRALLAWFTGTLRVRTFQEVVMFSDVTDVVETDVEAKTWRQPERVTLHITGRQDWRLRLFESGREMRHATLLQGILAGSTSFTDYR